MNIRRLLYVLLFLLVVLAGCTQRRKTVDFPTYTFTIDTLYPVTPTKHQGKSSNCWAYAVASLFETEVLMASGDTIHLSSEYLVRSKYLMQFDHYCYSGGKEEICKGGLGHSAVNAFRQCGIVPWNIYDNCYYDRPDYRALLKDIRRVAHKAVKHPLEENDYRAKLSVLLNSRMGVVPDSFPFRNRMFTPHSFAAQLPAHHNEYIELTSFSNYPYYDYCLLDLPDNWEHQVFYNLPLDEWINVMVNALQHGYTFAWDGDVSEAGFSMYQGFAICISETEVNEQTRLSCFLSGETTDDHMMHIIGLAHNQHNERFFIAKNSYGNIGPFGGCIYMSEEYVRMKTISILIDKKCLSMNK